MTRWSDFENSQQLSFFVTELSMAPNGTWLPGTCRNSLRLDKITIGNAPLAIAGYVISAGAVRPFLSA
jgi:hypothetical protein